MNKKKVLAGILSLCLVLGSFAACGTSSEPGTKNDKVLNESPESVGLAEANGNKASEVTAITGATDKDGNITDKKGILDKSGHRVYATGQKDNYGNMIYTTGKYASNGDVLYTKNEVDSFNHLIYYTGKYDTNGKLHLTPTNEAPDYHSNDKPAKPNIPGTAIKTTTVGSEIKADKVVSDAKSTFVKYFGGSSTDAFFAMDDCKDGGFVAAGISSSTDGDLTGSSKDWGTHSIIVKYNSDGSAAWKYVAGGDGELIINDVAELKDGSVVAAGYTTCTDTDAPLMSKSLSAFLVKLSKKGEKIWSYSFPGDKNQAGEYISAIAAAPDGGFVVGGKAISNKGFFTSSEKGNNTKAFLFKFDKNCNIKWRRILTGTLSNNFSAVDINKNGDIFAACVTTSTDGDFSGIRFSSPGKTNTVLIKFSKDGMLRWSDYLVGSGNSEYNAVKATSDGGCIIGGTFTIFKKADGIYSMGYGKSDGYVIKYTDDGKINWTRLVGGSAEDIINGITEIDGGYVVAGQTASVDYDFQGLQIAGKKDGFIFYLNEKGETTAKLLQIGSETDSITDVCTLDDGTISVAGWTQSKDKDFTGSSADKQHQAYVINFKPEYTDVKKK